jgi:hypothetical protein
VKRNLTLELLFAEAKEFCLTEGRINMEPIAKLRNNFGATSQDECTLSASLFQRNAALHPLFVIWGFAIGSFI